MRLWTKQLDEGLHADTGVLSTSIAFRYQKLEKGAPIPVVITIFADRSFSFEMKTPPVSFFLKKAAKVESGSKTPGRDKAGEVTKEQVKEIATQKMKDLNCDTVEAAMRMVEGSARSMGIEVRE